MKRFINIVLIVILILSVVVRFYRFTNPIADWQSWRQADTSAVSRNFIKYGFDLLHPTFEDLSNVPSGKDNPYGYRFVEFPLYNFAQAGLYVFFPNFSLEEWGRIVNILSSLLSIFFLYSLVKKYASTLAGLFAASFFAFLPFSIYYGRTILPDPSMVMATMAGIYFFDKWLESSKRAILNYNFYLALIFTAVALLLKPYAIFFILPMLVIAYNNFGWSILKKWPLWIFAFFSFLPLVLWRLWMLQYPEGIPANSWLLNGGDIRFKGAFFYWLFAERIGHIILGYWGLIILTFGILSISYKDFPRKAALFFVSFLISSLLYLTVIARGNVQHDYYQILILPTLAIFLGLGGAWLCHPPKDTINKYIGSLVFLVSTVFCLSFSWYFIRDYFNIDNSAIVVAGQAVNKLTPSNAKVVAPYNGDTALLYQTNRQGWPSFEKPLPDLISMGANYLVLVHPQPQDYALAKPYKIVSATADYLLIDLINK